MKEEKRTGEKNITRTERKAKLTPFPLSELTDHNLQVSWKFSVAKHISFKTNDKLFALGTESYFLCNYW